jgi:hypothetical protein
MFMNLRMPGQFPQPRSTAMVKVWPKNEDIRKFIKHPTGIAFSPDGSTDPAEWPDDQFTTRRIMDGDVLTSAPEALKAEKASKKSAE